jgi:enoyl-CoA hydratase/carnithine racemase
MMSEPPELSDALIRVDGRVVTLTFNRDDVRNELTGTKLVHDIVRTVEWLNSDDTVSVLILTGAGKAFSAGGNIKHMREREGSFGGDVYTVQKKYREGIQRVALAMDRLEIPSIVAINGPAVGAASTSLACVISASRRTKRLWARRSSISASFPATAEPGFCNA